MSSWLIYPFILGLVATVNPCGFPLLPIYLSLFIEGQDAALMSPFFKIQRALTAGFYATIGFILVFGLVGLIVEVGISGAGDMFAAWARYPLSLLGVLIALYGVATITGRNIRIPLPHIRPGLAQRRPLAVGLFGISYAVASLGCSLPLFIGGVASTFTHHGMFDGMETFLAYAVGMGLLLTIVALIMALSDAAGARRFRVLSPIVRPLGGLLLIAIGAYVSTYWISEIVDPTTSSGIEGFVNSIESHVTTYLQVNARILGIIFAIVICLALTVLTVRELHLHKSQRTSESGLT